MAKKIAIVLFLVVMLVALSLKLTYFKDPWEVSQACFGHEKGTEFVLIQEVQLIKYKDRYSLIPIAYDSYGELVDETRVEENLPPGTRLIFTRIEQKEDWTTGKYYVQYGRIKTSGYYQGEIFIGKLLHEMLEPTSKYLIPVDGVGDDLRHAEQGGPGQPPTRSEFE